MTTNFYDSTYDDALIEELYQQGFFKKVPSSEELKKIREKLKKKYEDKRKELRIKELLKMKNMIDPNVWGKWEEL